MNNLLTYEDFTDEVQLDIPELNLTGFNSFIARMQIKFFRTVLGVKLYNSFKTGIEAEPVLQIWTDLLDGCDYEDIYHFDGMTEAFKMYVYCEYLRSNQYSNVSGLFVIPKTENSTVVNPVSSFIFAQNRCIDLCDQTYTFIINNETDYPDLDFNYPYESRANLFGI